MKENNKQELSYFRLKLRSYMSEHHPERLQDTEFITTRADMALTAYCDAVARSAVLSTHNNPQIQNAPCL